MIKGITKRWMLNTLSVILTIIILIVVILIFAISSMFQSKVEQDLHAASNELSMVFSGLKRIIPPTSPPPRATMWKTLTKRSRWA